MLDEVFKALAPYPIVEGAVALLILIAGWRIMREGRKEGPSPTSPMYPSTHEYPIWFLGGPVHDSMVHIASMKHEMVRCREEMEELNKSNRRLVQVLEMIQNENVINPRRIRE